MCSGRAPVDLPARMLAAALAGEREQEAIKGLKLPNSTAQALIELLEAKRAALVEAVQAVDRARQVHAVEAPNGERLKTAQRQVASKTKAVGIAKLQLEHADEDDDLSTLQAALRERKTECAAAQSELAAATIELAAHLFEFPELRLRFPTAPFDAFLAAGGEASALRSLDEYDERETISHTRNEVEKAVFEGAPCALKLFKLTGASKQRAFLKEARRLRQLVHPHVVEPRAVFVDGKTSTGVLEMPLHRDLWHWLEAAPRKRAREGGGAAASKRCAGSSTCTAQASCTPT